MAVGLSHKASAPASMITSAKVITSSSNTRPATNRTYPTRMAKLACVLTMRPRQTRFVRLCRFLIDS